MAIAALHFQNFKMFRDAKLPLGRQTLLIGPNGTGKTSTLTALEILAQSVGGKAPGAETFRSVGIAAKGNVSMHVSWDPSGLVSDFVWHPAAPKRVVPRPPVFEASGAAGFNAQLTQIKVFSFHEGSIANPVPLVKTLDLDKSGVGIPNVLTSLQDGFPERFEQLNADLSRWLPEFDRVLLDTPRQGFRSFLLRTREGQHKIPATSLSQGTCMAVALLILCHLPNPPSIIGLEDPDRGMHPRLLREVLDAIRRLTNPEEFGDQRAPVQVIMTTHSPYFVDLFHDRPEDVVIVEKEGLWSKFQRLSDMPDFNEILHDAHLGEAWFTGVLGGVPAQT